MRRMRRRLGAFFSSPLLRRVAFHGRRLAAQVEPSFFRRLAIGIAAFVIVASVVVTLAEKEISLESFGASVNWAVTTVLGQGEASYVRSPMGYAMSWLLVTFGVAILATMTGALIGFVIEFLLKEGQGMGAAGFRDHIVVCGWNPIARELIEELRSDDYKAKVVLLHDADRSPAGEGVYFVRGDSSNAEDLKRAGIEEASAAIVFPSDATNEADMRSILAVMAIERLAPQVRTVVEVNNPRHAEHVRRAQADEVLVTSRLASRLLARSALYPGLSALVTDIVSGGEGSELYRVEVPDACIGKNIDEVSALFREQHRATLLAISRSGYAHVNPPPGFTVNQGDQAVVVAEKLGELIPGAV